MRAPQDTSPPDATPPHRMPPSSLESSDNSRNLPPARAVVRKRRQMTREEFIEAISEHAPPPQEFRSVETNKVQVYDDFVDRYLPKDVVPVIKAMRFLIDGSPRSPALSNVVDAMSLFVLYRASNDPRLEHSAMSSYAKALTLTRREVGHPNIDKRIVVGTAHMLTMCELFQSTSLSDMRAQPHSNWLLTFFETCRMQKDDEDLRLILQSSNIRLFATWGGLISRKRPCVPRLVPEPADLLPDGSRWTLTNLAVMVLDVVEDSDTLCEQELDPSRPRVLNAISEIVRAERKLHDWMAGYYKTTSYIQYRPVDQRQLSCTSTHRSPCLFPRVFDFHDLQFAFDYVTYWMCLLALNEAHIEIATTHHRRFDADFNDCFRLKKRSAEYADNICMSMPYFGQSSNGWSSRNVAIRPLQFLLVHFKRHCDWQKLAWVVQCAAHIGSVRVDPGKSSSKNPLYTRRAST